MGRDVHAKLTLDDMVPGDVVFAASGVTHGSMFDAVHFEHHHAHVDTLVWDSFNKRKSRVRSIWPDA
jgi:fructose-1,6-bisphosphatase/sedoheptulose 1,7-bisphosphatase-like protein